MERKVAFVTGAGMGIGMGIAIEFAKAGYDVAIHHSPASRENAQEVCKKLESYGARTLAVEGDLRNMDAIYNMFAKVEEKFGGLDVFVNNAGVTMGGLMLDVEPETWDTCFEINVKAALFCLQQAGRNMIKYGKQGHIVVVLSNQIHYYGLYTSVYPSTKVALEKVVQAAAIEFIPFGIHVNGIAPGYVDTGSPRMGAKEPTYNSIPARRWVSLEEMGQVALFLCGPWTKSMVGEVIMMDGGATLNQAGPRLWEYKERMEKRFSEATCDEEMFGRAPAEKEQAEMRKKWGIMDGKKDEEKK